MDETFYAEYALAERGHWWFAARRRILQTVIDATLGPDDRRTLLEAGSGTGAMGEMLGRYGTFVGLDVNWLALAAAHAKVERLVGGSLERLPFHDRAFDAVFACDVLEHVDDDVTALRELRRVCKPGGTLFVTVPAFAFLWSDHDEVNRHHRRYTRPALASLLTSTGWRVGRLTYFNTLLFPAIAGVRLVAGRLASRSEAPRSDLDRRMPRALNAALEAVFASERHLVRRLDLPFGVSLLAIASPG